MPSWAEFLTTGAFDGAGLVVSVLLTAGYLACLIRLRGRGEPWPLARTLAFIGLGIGSLLWVTQGFLGAYAEQLRWAFTLKVALLLCVCPLLMSLGKPFLLAKSSFSHEQIPAPLRSLLTGLAKALRNPLAAPLLALLVFGLMLTPVAGELRTQPALEAIPTVVLPLLGLFLFAPLTDSIEKVVGSLIILEILFAFIELLADAIPGIILRLSTHVLDGVSAIPHAAQPWFPNPLRDQQIAGDWLWFIAEVSDVPLLILMFMRFQRSDKAQASSLDALSDEEMDALNEAHLARADERASS